MMGAEILDRDPSPFQIGSGVGRGAVPRCLTATLEAIPMDEKPEAHQLDEKPEAPHRGEGARRSFYVVWSPEGGNPVVRFPAFELARRSAWKLSEKYPGQSFFVLKSCWGRLARAAEIPVADAETREGGEPVDPA
jgi:hypothetical protein